MKSPREARPHGLDLSNVASADLEDPAGGVRAVGVADGSDEGSDIVRLRVLSNVNEHHEQQTYLQVREHLWRHDSLGHGGSSHLKCKV